MAFDWTPVVTVSGTLLGVLIGNYGSGRRERNKIVKEEEFKRQAHWRDKKLELYSDLIDQVGTLIHACDSIINQYEKPEERAKHVYKAQELTDSIALLRARLQLLGTEEIYKAYQDVGRSSYDLLVASLEAMRDKDWTSENRIGVGKLARRQLKLLTDLIQDDLHLS